MTSASQSTSFFKQSYNARHISWDGCDVFLPPNVGFYDLVSEKPEIQH